MSTPTQARLARLLVKHHGIRDAKPARFSPDAGHHDLATSVAASDLIETTLGVVGAVPFEGAVNAGETPRDDGPDIADPFDGLPPADVGTSAGQQAQERNANAPESPVLVQIGRLLCEYLEARKIDLGYFKIMEIEEFAQANADKIRAAVGLDAGPQRAMATGRDSRPCTTEGCGEDMHYVKPYAADPDSGVEAWRGGWGCSGCGRAIENPAPSED